MEVCYHKYLDTYTLEQILELNELSPEDALQFMVEQEFVQLPDVKPIDLMGD